MTESPLLGVIADDYTGAADIASMLREQGVRTGLLFGLQSRDMLAELSSGYQALVIALKTRSAPVQQAREESARALEQLRELGARQVHLKYCSTFDSTAEGNIGPVIDVLLDGLGADFTVAVPALPVNGRTQYMGYLFVGDKLLSESHMRHHPLTPMTESNLVRHLEPQTSRRVGLIAHPYVRQGTPAVEARIRELRAEGIGIALVDATSDDDLLTVAGAVADLPLTTGGSGLGITLPRVWQQRGLLPTDAEPELELAGGAGTLVLAGSCSAITLEQLRVTQQVEGPGLRVDVLRLLGGERDAELERLLDGVRRSISDQRWALVYSSAGPEEREALLRDAAGLGMGSEAVSERLERATGEIARRAVDEGLVDTLVVAGGETTGAVTQALDLRALEIGPALDPGVPLARAIGDRPLNVVFKSGNFGSPDFFLKALSACGGRATRGQTAEAR